MITYFNLKVMDSGSKKVIYDAMAIPPSFQAAYYVGYGPDKDLISVDYLPESDYTIKADGYKDEIFKSDQVISEGQTFEILLKRKPGVLNYLGLGLIGFWLIKKIKK